MLGRLSISQWSAEHQKMKCRPVKQFGNCDNWFGTLKHHKLVVRARSDTGQRSREIANPSHESREMTLSPIKIC